VLKHAIDQLQALLTPVLRWLFATLPRQRLATPERDALEKPVALHPISHPASGWALLRGQTSSGGTTVQIQLILIEARLQTVELLSGRDGRFCEIIAFPQNVDHVRIAATSGKALSAIEHLSLTEIPDWERRLRLLNRVWSFRPKELLNRPIKNRFRNLESLYEAIRRNRVRRFSGDTYAHFIEEIESAQIKEVASVFLPPKNGPFFTVVLYGEKSKSAATLSSLERQTYPHWSVHSLATPPLDESGCIEWVLPLRAGDILPPHALLLIAQTANACPAACMIYSDHDFLSASGDRIHPIFKPDWNLDLFLTHDYIASPRAFSAAACAQHRINPEQLTCSESRYHLTLLIAQCSPESIQHIPSILLHRNHDHPSTTGGEPAPRGPLERYLSLFGATVVPGPLPETHRVLWPISSPPLVSILIATRDQFEILRNCIESIQSHTTYPNWEIVLVDNQSTEPATLDYLDELKRAPNIKILSYDRPFNYSAIQNFAASQCRGEVIALLNNDVEVIAPTWLEDLVRQALRPRVGAVGARLLYSDGRIQHAGVALGIGGVAGHLHRYYPGTSPGYCGRIQLSHQLTAVTAACLVVRKTAFEAVGGFNDQHLKIALNDVDFCLKLHALGLTNIYEPSAVLYHHESISRGPDDTFAKRRVFLREREWMLQRWPDLIARDPHYNPNLTLEHEDCSVTTRNHAQRVASTFSP
jgi:GT2 family glycosyltransferase